MVTQLNTVESLFDANVRLSSAIERQQTQQTASASITSPAQTDQTQQTTPAQAITQEVTQRTTTPPGAIAGEIQTGRVRHPIEDSNNLVLATQIQSTKQSATTTKAQNDATKALQKLQSKCNHKYNKATRLCEFCGKNRSSHVHD
jgi:hypothetical protein